MVKAMAAFLFDKLYVLSLLPASNQFPAYSLETASQLLSLCQFILFGVKQLSKICKVQKCVPAFGRWQPAMVVNNLLLLKKPEKN